MLAVLGITGVETWQWWQAHRPRARVLTAERQSTGKLDALGVSTINNGKVVLPKAIVRFDQGTASLDQVNAAEPKGITLKPAHPGHWRWETDRTLVFTPDKDWPAGSPFDLALDRSVLPKETHLKANQWELLTPPLAATVANQEFYTDPSDPSVHQVVIALQFNYPVAKAELEKHIKVTVLGGAPLFAWNGQTPKTLFTVVEGKDQRQFWVRTSRIQVPAKEDYVKASVTEGLQSLNGGKGLEKAVDAKVLVPDATTGLRVTTAETKIIRTDEGDPEQFVFLNTEGYATGAEMAKHLEAWLLPKDKPAEGKQKVIRNHEWQSPREVTPAVLAASRKIELKHVEAEQPWTEVHAFKFLVEDAGTLWLRVKGGMPGVGGFRLATDATMLAPVPEFPQEIEVVSKGALLALNGERKLSVKARGVGHIRYSIARVPAGQVNHLVTLTEGDFQSQQFRESWLFDEKNIARIHREVLPLPTKNNYQAAYNVFDFSQSMQVADSSDPDASRGLFFLTAEGIRKRTPDDPEPDNGEADGESGDDAEWITLGGDAYSRRFVLVTDLGLLVKQNADGSRDVFVQSIEQGVPINGARVLVLAKNGEFVAEALTEDGHVHLADVAHLKREKQPVAILARLGNDLSFIPFNRVDRALNFSRFDTAGVLASEKESLDAFLFTERGVYRPGDTVNVGGIVRRRDWEGTLAGLPVEIEVTDARDQLVKQSELALPQDGYFTWDCSTDEANPTGVYRATLYLRTDDKRQRIGYAVFRVEEFQPDRMKLAVELNPAAAGKAWIQPKDLAAAAHLETLFGFAAADRRIKAKMDLSPAEFAFPQYAGFVFHKSAVKESEQLAGKTIELGEQKTDAGGNAKFDLALDRFGEASFQMNLLVEAFEADGGRSVRGGMSVMVSPQSFVVGYQGDGDLNYIAKDSGRNVKFVALDQSLQRQVVEGVSYRVIQIRHVSVLTKREDDSYAYVSTAKEEFVSDGPFALGSGSSDFPLPTHVAGEFRLELRDPENQVICACTFSVVGKGDPTRSLERNTELDLKLARDQWNSGDNVEMSLTAPFAGSGLITLERERVLGWKWFKSPTAGSVHQIPVPADIEGTAYANVSFVRALDSPEVFMSPLSYAVKPFTANPDKRRLGVSVEAPALIKPGEALKISYRTTEPSRIIVYAVDEGIHQITGYKLPEPLPHFLRKRALEVETEQLLDLILPEYSILARMSASGGDEDEAPKLHLNPFKRRKEAPVVFWSGLLAAGPEMREVSYTVPDYFAGRLKLMAVAVSADRIGAAQAETTARGPFVLTPNVPTFASPGDEVTVSLTVANNLEGQSAPSAINWSLTTSEHLKLIESPPNPLEVAPGKEATTRLRLQATDQLGGAEMTFRAEGGGQAMERKATLSVRPAAPYMTEVQSGYFRLAHQEVKTGRQMYPQFAKREATASVLPLGLARGLEAYLREFPYGCSEQITSRAMSRLVLSGEADFGFSRSEAVEQLDSAFALLGQRQNGDGGFGYWDSRGEAGVDFLSMYVTQFLIEAGDAGFAVPEELVEGSRKKMRDMAKAKVGSLDEAWIQAAAIYLLTRQGEVTTPYLLNLRDTLDTKMAEGWKHHATAAYVAATYLLLKKNAEAEKLIDEYWHHAKDPSEAARWQGAYGADPQVRRALAFGLVCRHFPEMAGKFGYDDIAAITEPIARGEFNTITSACTILALKQYSALAKHGGVQVSMAELLPQAPEPRLLAPDSDGLRTTPFSSEAKGVRFALSRPAGAPDIGAFYQIVTAGYDLKPPQQAVREGLEVVRELADASGKVVTHLQTGQGVTVNIRVRNLGNHDRSDVAVLDLLPGGFEVEPDNLRPGVATVPGTQFVEVREDRNVFFLDLRAGETKTISYRIKPVCAGTFVVPPVFTEAMYDRGIRGLSLASTIKVASTD